MSSKQLWQADIVSNVLGKLSEGREAMKVFQNLGQGAGQSHEYLRSQALMLQTLVNESEENW